MSLTYKNQKCKEALKMSDYYASPYGYTDEESDIESLPYDDSREPYGYGMQSYGMQSYGRPPYWYGRPPYGRPPYWYGRPPYWHYNPYRPPYYREDEYFEY